MDYLRRSARVSRLQKISHTNIRIFKYHVSCTDWEISELFIFITYVSTDRLVGLVVSMSGYWSWGRGFDPRHFHKF